MKNFLGRNDQMVTLLDSAFLSGHYAGTDDWALIYAEMIENLRFHALDNIKAEIQYNKEKADPETMAKAGAIAQILAETLEKIKSV